MVQNKIVVHYLDGSVMKGFTVDFTPNKDILHLVPLNAPSNAQSLPVSVQDLKAVFFVKDFRGDALYREKKEFDPTTPVMGRKIKVVFRDGEHLVGTTQGYEPGRRGFFVFPADPKSNNTRCYVVSPATRTISFL